MTWLSHSWPQVLHLLGQHLLISIPAIVVAALISLPLGAFAARRRVVGAILVNLASLLYTIPALPLLVIIPLIVAIPLRSKTNVLLALIVYGVALLARSATEAFRAVDQDTIIAAQAQGMSTWQLFWRVRLPLALPAVIAGARVVAVSTIGLVTIGALIGVSSLGTLFTDGFQRGIYAEVLTGIVLTVALALSIDGLLLLLARLSTRWRTHG